MDEILDTVLHDEFVEWAAFQSVDPTSESRADYRAAVLVAVVRSIASDAPIDPGAVMHTYFDFDRPEPEPVDIDAVILGWGRALQKRFARSRKKRGT